jgi:REP element-mobilizing transposase RayT
VPRGPRVDAPGTTHHVVFRGIERRAIFADDLDRRRLLERMSEVLVSEQVRCLAWALMTNHVHLVLRTGAQPLARAMSRVLTGYAGDFNRRQERAGHLFQNRYFSRPVLDDGDLLAVIRYVHRNPLAAGVVASLAALESFPWAGHGALVARLPAWPFHAVAEALAAFGKSPAAARPALRSFMAGADDRTHAAGEADPDGRRPATGAQGRRLVSEVCERLGVDPADLAAGRRAGPVSRARLVAAQLAVERGLPLTGLAAELGVSVSALSQALRRARGRSVG